MEFSGPYSHMWAAAHLLLIDRAELGPLAALRRATHEPLREPAEGRHGSGLDEKIRRRAEKVGIPGTCDLRLATCDLRLATCDLRLAALASPMLGVDIARPEPGHWVLGSSQKHQREGVGRSLGIRHGLGGDP